MSVDPAVAAPPEQVTLDDLVAAAARLIDPARRRILGITGAPGAGKSTVAEALVTALAPDAVLVGMDGFHLRDDELRRLGRHERKGAPDTFDAAGYTYLLRRLRERAADVVYAPLFDRSLEESIGSAVPVPGEPPLVSPRATTCWWTSHPGAPLPISSTSAGTSIPVTRRGWAGWSPGT